MSRLHDFGTMTETKHVQQKEVPRASTVSEREEMQNSDKDQVTEICFVSKI